MMAFKYKKFIISLDNFWKISSNSIELFSIELVKYGICVMVFNFYFSIIFYDDLGE